MQGEMKGVYWLDAYLRLESPRGDMIEHTMYHFNSADKLTQSLSRVVCLGGQSWGRIIAKLNISVYTLKTQARL